MFCSRCGVEIPEESGFCNKCGAPQGGAARPSKPPGIAPADSSRPAEALTEPSKESELWTGRYSPRSLGGAFLLAGAWFVGLWIAYFLLSGRDSWFHGRGWFVWVFVVLSPIPLLWAGSTALWRRMTLRYRLTTQRFFVQRGLIGRDVEELELIRVDDVSTSQGIIERIFNVGTVTIISTDATHPRLEVPGIASPVELKEKIRALMKEVRKRSVHFEQL
ncbi:MAG: PH domain-containing protein [Candidatus Brocadiae bacterium]|nr:PH domain-containing protein [Candidatus Brocadiia bacterium]